MDEGVPDGGTSGRRNTNDGRERQLLISGLGLLTLLVTALLLAPPASATHRTSPDIQEVVAIRVYFNDYSEASRYNRSEVETFYQDRLDDLFRNTSYGDVGWKATVTDLYQLPKDRSNYIDDKSDGDLSEGKKFRRVLDDAIAQLSTSERSTLADADAVNVIMAETDPSEFHRGQAKTCNFDIDVGGDTESVRLGCAIFSENPSSNDAQVWGRWAHELGHVLQDGGPAHPSGYDNEFELMDSNYPGHISALEKSDHDFLGPWLPEDRVVSVVKGEGGSHCVRAIEYDPATKPNPVILKVPLTDTSYYLVSFHQRIRGDELNGDFANGIPDEGVLIERVVEGGDPWVDVQGNPGRNTLWKQGDTYTNSSDGVTIEVDPQRGDEESRCINVSYGNNAAQPDVGIHPWRSPPGNTWETTDIWVDSPVNDYGTYRYGTWDDGTGNMVPTGNGDDPALGQENRIYVRVRNFGDQPATDVEVTIQITDPPGVGIQGASAWTTLGTVDKSDFSDLSSIPAGDFVDVYIEWTPGEDLAPDDLEEGRFQFHTCIRVKIGSVSGEKILANQDGDEEQENIGYFEAPVDEDADQQTGFTLQNDDLAEPKFFHLDWKEELPDDWELSVNNGDPEVEVPAGGERFIPVEIGHKPGRTPGESFGTDVKATFLELLDNELDPTDKHPVFDPLGGVRFEARAVKTVDLTCKAEQEPNGIHVSGQLTGMGEYGGQETKVVQAIARDPDTGQPAADDWEVGAVDAGRFSFLVPVSGEPAEVACLFAGTQELSSASSGYVPVQAGSGTEVDLAVDKEAGTEGNVTVGDDLVYTVSVENLGPGTATNVVLTDDLPDDVTLLDTTISQGSCSAGTPLSCSLGEIGAGTTATLEIRVNVTATGTLVNTVQVTTDSDDVSAANDGDSVEIQAVADITPGFEAVAGLVALAGVATIWARRRR